MTAYLETPSGRLSFDEAGAGPLALFLHGGGLDRTIWSEQLAELADLRRCVAVDLPDHGHSPAGQFDIAFIVDALGDSTADLVGHSVGAHLALAAWRDHPNVVRSMALFGVMFSEDMTRGPAPTLDAAVDDMLARSAYPELRARVRALREGWVPAAGFGGLTFVPADAQAEAVASVSVPILIASGDDDRSTPRALSHRFADANSHARWVEITDCGHLASLEQPAEVSAILRSWWSELDWA